MKKPEIYYLPKNLVCTDIIAGLVKYMKQNTLFKRLCEILLKLMCPYSLARRFIISREIFIHKFFVFVFLTEEFLYLFF